MNILFVDIEGTLSNARTATASADGRSLDPIAANMIATLCRVANLRICITSTWRIDHDSLASFKQQLFELGGGAMAEYIFDDENLWKTPVSGSRNRGSEIETWLDFNKEVVEQYLIIDDDDFDMSTEQMSRFVLSDKYDGFSFQNYLDCIKILTKGS